MLTNAKDIAAFKKLRTKYKKKNVSVTVIKDRIENIHEALEGRFFGFAYLNETEKYEFLFIIMELLMKESLWFDNFRTIEQIEADEKAKSLIERAGTSLNQVPAV